MPVSLDSIVSEAILLPRDQRYALAQRILESIDGEGGGETDIAWDIEIRDRIRRYDTGLAQGIPGDLVFDELNRELGR